MLLIDRVLEIETGHRILCLKNVTQNEPFFQGHFPGQPVMPGVFTVEALAQAAGLLFMHDREDLYGRVIYFVGIERARFRRLIVPGDQLHLEVQIKRLRGTYGVFSCRATVGGEVAVEAVCSSMLTEG
jgi:3-hydroxyacyl-[acyl-carrier-protein] dehydratase